MVQDTSQALQQLSLPSHGTGSQIVGRAKQERFRRLIENSGTAPPTPTTQVYAVGELGK